MAEKYTYTQSRQAHRALSMHDGIAEWCDCCVCEAEPYWAQVADEMGIDLSDYEPQGSDKSRSRR